MNDTQRNDTNTQSDESSVTSQSTEQSREQLKAILQVGLTIQMISVVIAFAMKKGSEDFLRKLNDLLLEYNTHLSPEDKKELADDTNRMIDQKAQELVESLGEQLSPEDLQSVIDEMKHIAG